MGVEPDALWAFSLAFYARPGASACFLRCQEEAGADVNLLLFLLWHAQQGRVVTELADIDRAVRVWRDNVVRPLRVVRKFLKPLAEAAALRETVKGAELESEHLEQGMLQSLSVPDGPSAPAQDAARASLLSYGAFLEVPLPGDCVETLVRLL